MQEMPLLRLLVTAPIRVQLANYHECGVGGEVPVPLKLQVLSQFLRCLT